MWQTRFSAGDSSAGTPPKHLKWRSDTTFILLFYYFLPLTRMRQFGNFDPIDQALSAMNRIVSRLLSLSLLTLTLGCNKDKGPSPDALTDDPTGLPMPSPDCRIVKETFRTADITSNPVTIILEDNQKVQVGRAYTSNYRYDSQGRISEILTQKNSGQEILTCSYTPASITQHFVSKKSDGSIDRESIHSAPLNVSGFLSRPFASGPFTKESEHQVSLYEYDEEGHQAEHFYSSASGKGQLWEKNIYVNGNRVKQYWLSAYAPGDSLVRSYQYNLNRPDLPITRTYYGKANRNLPVKILLSNRNNFFGDGPLYETRYTYLFDRQGRVRRCIAVGRQLNPQYLVDENVGTVNVTDYEYD